MYFTHITIYILRVPDAPKLSKRYLGINFKANLDRAHQYMKNAQSKGLSFNLNRITRMQGIGL